MSTTALSRNEQHCAGCNRICTLLIPIPGRPAAWAETTVRSRFSSRLISAIYCEPCGRALYADGQSRRSVAA